MRKISRLHSYTLVETMFVIFFFVVISAFVFRFYYRFDYSYRASIDNAVRMRRIMNIGERWRKALDGASGQVPVIENGKIIFDKNDYAAVDKKQIIIHRCGKTYLLRLPENTNAAFSIEDGPDGGSLAILNLNWKNRRSQNKKAPGRSHSVRIAAALEIKHGDKS